MFCRSAFINSTKGCLYSGAVAKMKKKTLQIARNRALSLGNAFIHDKMLKINIYFNNNQLWLPALEMIEIDIINYVNHLE